MVCALPLATRNVRRLLNRWTGKQWKPTKQQFRPGMRSARKTFEERQAERTAMVAMKAREKEMKDEKIQKKKVLPTSAPSLHFHLYRMIM